MRERASSYRGGMTKTVTGSAPPALTPLQWTICGVAALGFAFDTYELLMLPLIVRPALAELLGVEPQQPRRQLVGRHDAVRAGRRRRHLRADRRLPDGSVRSPARAGVEHPALRLLSTGGRFRDVGRVAALLALLHLRRRLRRVRCGGCLARRSCSPIPCSASASSATRRRSAPSAA